MNHAQTLFRLVTGRDFGRAIKWARSQRNPVDEALRAELARVRAQRKGGR